MAMPSPRYLNVGIAELWQEDEAVSGNDSRTCNPRKQSSTLEDYRISPPA